jgi:hypothetical protein
MVLSSISASNNADAMMIDETAHGKRSLEAARGTNRVSLCLYEPRAKEKGRQRRQDPRKNEQDQVKYSLLLLMLYGNCI